MQVAQLIKRISLDFYVIPREAKSFPGSVLKNCIKLFFDKCIKTIGYLWHILFRNKKYDGKLDVVGNYRLIGRYLSENSVVYSCGIAENISFDKEVSNKFGCDVYMFDPTEKSRDYMKTVDNPKLIFYNIGIWSLDGEIKFYHPNDPGHGNFSATNMFHSDTYISMPCKTITSIMSEHGHSKIDVLKMDIEGAAFEVLNGILDKNVHPEQIVVELERPFFIFHAKIFEIFKYLVERYKLRMRLKKLGYKLVELKANELLAIRNS